MVHRLPWSLRRINRLALLAFAWSHRRTILRWLRSLWAEIRSPRPLDYQRLRLLGRVLWAITRDDRFSTSEQLRRVQLDGDVVVVDASPGWSGRAHLADELQTIPGVAAVIDRAGRPLEASIVAAAT